MNSKKIIGVIVGLLISITTWAQLNIGYVEEQRFENIGTVRSHYSCIYYYCNSDPESSIFFLSIKSNSIFDCDFAVGLGKSKESSILTLQDMIEVCDDGDFGTLVYFTEGFGRQALLIKDKVSGKNAITICEDGWFGTCNITRDELVKAIGLIKKAKL